MLETCFTGSKCPAVEAFGPLYLTENRCTDCPKAFCEDCLDWTGVKLVGDSIERLVALGYGADRSCFWITCSACMNPIEHAVHGAAQEDDDIKILPQMPRSLKRKYSDST